MCFPPISNHQINIVLIKDSADIDNMLVSWCLEKLSGREREKYARFHFDKDRRLYMLSRVLLRYSLAAYIKCDPNEITFGVEAFGKPFLKNNSNVKFNLTHSNGVAAVAIGVADGVDIGIDIESTESDNDFLDMGLRHFSPEECSLLKNCRKDQQKALFYKLWTLKEAYIKAIGKGLSIDLNSFAFDISGDRITVRHHENEIGDKTDWHFMQARVYARHIVAIAVRGQSGLREGHHFQAFDYCPGGLCRPLILKDAVYSDNG